MRMMIRLADALAEYAHRNQKRKYSDNVPYIEHPRAVAAIVEQYGGTEAMIAAALMHDVLEDTEVRLPSLKVFPDEVVDMVIGLTDRYTPKAFPEINREARKALEAIRLGNCSAEVQTIKTADLIHNTISIVAYDPGFARVYLKEKARCINAMDKAHPDLRKWAIDTLKHHGAWEEAPQPNGVVA